MYLSSIMINYGSSNYTKYGKGVIPQYLPAYLTSVPCVSIYQPSSTHIVSGPPKFAPKILCVRTALLAPLEIATVILQHGFRMQLAMATQSLSPNLRASSFISSLSQTTRCKERPMSFYNNFVTPIHYKQYKFLERPIVLGGGT